jgi:hypothetical protein
MAGVGLVAVGALTYELLPSGGGPAHEVTTPQRLGSYIQMPALATSMKATQLRNSIVAQSGGEASHVVDAVYETPSQQIMLFIGGNLKGSSASSFISSFIGSLPGSAATSAGSLGGEAACVPSISGRPAECAWADNDTFGVLLSPTLSAGGLASELRQMRPQVEHLAK